MRALFTLIKRLIVDNAVYFLAAIAISAVLIIAIISITLSEELMDLSFYTITLLITTPILVGIGSYTLGLVHVYSDKTSGVTATLSVLPIRQGQILIARLVTGTLIILTLLGPLAITGAVLWELLGPPDWLFHNWLVDTFIGLSLASLVCYCLGLVAARRAETFTSALRALPLVPILMLLIVIKGFDWPLLAVLLPLLAVLLLHCFKSDSNRFMTIIATGFATLVLLAIPLYFGRYLCDGLLVTKMEANAKVSPSGLLPMEIENDPNVVDYSEVLGSMKLASWHSHCVICKFLESCRLVFTKHFQVSHHLLENSGIIEYLQSRGRGERITYTARFYNRPQARINIIHINEVRGQIVYQCTSTNTRYNRFTWHWKDVAEIYAGPEGISSDPDTTGRFSSPTVYYDLGSSLPWATYLLPYIVYDRDSRRFYAIDFERQIIRKGPKLPDSSVQPANAGLLPQSEIYSPVEFYLPSTKNYRNRRPIDVPKACFYLPILDASGRIDLLDLRTLTLIGPAGHLPRPRTLFGWASSKPRNLLDYDVDVVWLIPSGIPQSTRLISRYTSKVSLGVIAASVSRQGMWTSVAVFDKNGKKIKSANSKATFFDMPGGPVLTITKYIFESLHPPVLTLASFFTAYSFDARSAHRALFLMPNSFVAMARDYEGNIFYMSLIIMLLMLPGILFAALLGWRVTRDATILGLSRNAKRFWLTATLVFGLPVYITYRLTRPKITLVTCVNCGKPRRPDTDICHRCGSKWDVPELKPPSWRVLNGAEQVLDNSLTEETAGE